jgi:hypothetical protein
MLSVLFMGAKLGLDLYGTIIVELCKGKGKVVVVLN